jgi:hypothetical protein
MLAARKYSLSSSDPQTHEVTEVTWSRTRPWIEQSILATSLFNGGHPVIWARPVGNWITACEKILAWDVEVGGPRPRAHCE